MPTLYDLLGSTEAPGLSPNLMSKMKRRNRSVSRRVISRNSQREMEEVQGAMRLRPKTPKTKTQKNPKRNPKTIKISKSWSRVFAMSCRLRTKSTRRCVPMFSR